MESLGMDNMDGVMTLVMAYVPKVLLAIAVLLVGLWLIKRVVKITTARFEERGDVTVARFTGSMISIGLKTMLIISVIGMIGVETTSFIAVIGAAGLAIGLALQGTLANFAGGFLIALFRPYKVGDFIDAQGVAGTVKEVQIFNTVLTTPDNKRIIVPNGLISNGIITNISAEPKRRVDFVFGIGYSDDVAKAREVIQSQIQADERIDAEPAPVIVVSELGDNSVNFTVRVWCDAANYWGIYFDLIEGVKNAFDREGISIPFPQRDVHVYNAE